MTDNKFLIGELSLLPIHFRRISPCAFGSWRCPSIFCWRADSVAAFAELLPVRVQPVVAAPLLAVDLLLLLTCGFLLRICWASARARQPVVAAPLLAVDLLLLLTRDSCCCICWASPVRVQPVLLHLYLLLIFALLTRFCCCIASFRRAR